MFAIADRNIDNHRALEPARMLAAHCRTAIMRNHCATIARPKSMS
jgi:hypothetical protein